MYAFVKSYDEKFTAAHDVSEAVLNEDGTSKVFDYEDMQKVSGTYTRDGSGLSFVMNSGVLYADKKRTHSLLRSMGLHRPIELLRSGFIGSISYKGENVNISGEKFYDILKEKSQHSVPSSEEAKQQVSAGLDKKRDAAYLDAVKRGGGLGA